MKRVGEKKENESSQFLSFAAVRSGSALGDSWGAGSLLCIVRLEKNIRTFFSLFSGNIVPRLKRKTSALVKEKDRLGEEKKNSEIFFLFQVL